jgi:hypothetical protein
MINRTQMPFFIYQAIHQVHISLYRIHQNCQAFSEDIFQPEDLCPENDQATL